MQNIQQQKNIFITKLYKKQLLNLDKKLENDNLFLSNKQLTQENLIYQDKLFEIKKQISYIEEQNKELLTINNNYEIKDQGNIKLIDSLKKQLQNKEKKSNIVIKNILCVDDSIVIRTKMKKTFLSEGYNIILAKDGVEAINFLSKQNFDLIITDFEMPNANGTDVIIKAKNTKLNSNTPVILITSHEEMHINIENFENIYGIYRKPWNDTILLNKLKIIFN